MTVDQIIDFIKNVGVPTGIAAFVLWRLDKRLADVIVEMRSFHDKIGDAIDASTETRRDIIAARDHVVREVGHDVRAAIAALPFRRTE